MAFTKTGLGTSLGIVEPTKPAPKKEVKPQPVKHEPKKAAPKAN